MTSEQDTAIASGGVLDETTVQADAGTFADGKGSLRGPDPAFEPLKRGSTVDRYVILELLGAGGMGVVYAAYDPNLDRRVALKLLLGPDTASRASTSGRARTLREAQAMAKLAHPNVVTVHDVGTADDSVYIAMELVAGQTLTDWIEAKRRSWREVLDVFEAAGAGLCAAHDAGLMHRDFKLDNVMVGDDGRIRVMDFGLARSTGEDSTQSASSEWSMELEDVDRLTRTGALVGTPAYMAPELLDGSPGDARADQFAFCVALFRCLYGRRPFEGSSLAELYESTTRGNMVSTPIAKTPRWLAVVVRRGLHAKPGRRYASMHALLRAVARGRRRRSRIAAGVGVGSVAVAASAASFVASARECSGGEARYETVWNADVAAAIARAFDATGAGQASDASARVSSALDEYGEAWATSYRAACAANQRGEQSDAMLDRRMACLGEKLAEVGALLDVLATADRSAVAHAVVAVEQLSTLESCGDIERLLDEVHTPGDPETREAVEDLRAKIAKASGLSKAGKYNEAYEAVLAAQRVAQETGFRPVIAEIEHALAALQLDLGRPAEARAHAEQACFEAEASENDLIAAKAWTMRIQLEGVTLAKHEAGHEAIRRAEAAVIRAGESPELRADVELAKGALAVEEGRHQEALEGYRRAVVLAEQAGGTESLLVADATTAVGNAQFKLGNLGEAIASYERAYGLQVAALGEQHPDCASTLQNIGAMELMLGRAEAGRARLEQTLAVFEATLGPEHAKVGETLFNLGWAAQKMDDPEGALDYFARARAVEIPRLGEDHPLVGQYEASIAVVLIDMERWSEARDHLLAAKDIFVKAHGPKHNFVARVVHDLGKCEAELGHLEAAEAHLEQALEIRRASLPPDHPELADTLHRYAKLLVAHERFEDALPLARQLVTARTAHRDDDPGDVVVALLLVGDVHVGLGERSSARERFGAAVKAAEGLDAALQARASARLAGLDADR